MDQPALNRARRQRAARGVIIRTPRNRPGINGRWSGIPANQREAAPVCRITRFRRIQESGQPEACSRRIGLIPTACKRYRCKLLAARKTTVFWRTTAHSLLGRPDLDFIRGDRRDGRKTNTILTKMTQKYAKHTAKITKLTSLDADIPVKITKLTSKSAQRVPERTTLIARGKPFVTGSSARRAGPPQKELYAEKLLSAGDLLPDGAC